jgi:hypothetical protein
LVSSSGDSPSLPRSGSSSLLEENERQLDNCKASGCADNLKNLHRLDDSGIWKPHCQPVATFRSSVGTLGLLFRVSPAEGQVDMTCCTLGYSVSAWPIPGADEVTYSRGLGPSDTGICCPKVYGYDDSPVIHRYPGMVRRYLGTLIRLRRNVSQTGIEYFSCRHSTKAKSTLYNDAPCS